MNWVNPAFLQIGIDLALLVAILFLLWRVNSGLKNPLIKSQKDMIQELKSVVRESQEAGDAFLKAMEQSRLAIKEMALELEIKEKRVKALLDKSKTGASAGPSRTPAPAGAPADRYAEVDAMIRQGASREQTARETGFTEAEIGLILDLYRVRQETD
ncbi:MAG TPA: hypothetical protein PK090_11270 [Smithellaceae bacterium]|nr:hypothetical protein [Smithellaceae bacterium]